jgi:hypothetical protein
MTKDQLQVQVNAVHEEMSNVEANVNKTFVDATNLMDCLKIETSLRGSDISVRINDPENKYHRRSSLVNIDIRNFYDWKDEETEIQYTVQHGSGGWEDETTAVQLCEVQMEVFEASRNILQAVQADEDFYRTAVLEYRKLNKMSGDLFDRIRVIENDEKYKEFELAISPVLDWMQEADEDYIQEMLAIEDGNYRSKGFYAVKFEQGWKGKFRICVKFIFADKCGSRKTNYVNLERTALAKILDSNYLIASVDIAENHQLLDNKEFDTAEELYEYIETCKAA